MFYNFRKNKKAFTLVELIVVIAIIAILGAVVGVVVSGFVVRARKTAATSPVTDFADQWQVNVNDAAPVTLNVYIKSLFPNDFAHFCVDANNMLGKKPGQLNSADFYIYYHDDNCGDYYGKIHFVKNAIDKSNVTTVEALPSTVYYVS